MTSTAAAPEAPTELDVQLPELWDYVRASGLRTFVSCASKNPNAKIIVLLISPATGRPVLAVKVPTTAAASHAVESEVQLLRTLPQVAPSFAGTIPAIVGAVEFDGRRGVVMTAVEGTSMATTYLRRSHTTDANRVGADFAAIDSWLREFQGATAGSVAPLDMDGGVVTALRSRFAHDAAVARDLERLLEIHASLRTISVPRTAVHGDLWLANVLVSGGSVSGVVDWEAGAISGQPIRDLARFALMYALFLDRRTRGRRWVRGHPGLRAGDWGAGVAYAIEGAGWFPELFRAFIRNGLERLGGDSSLWRDVALAGIAEVAAYADDDTFAREHLLLFRRLARAGSPARGPSVKAGDRE